MDRLSVSELARSWYRDVQPARSGDPACNILFGMLYNAYCRRNGIDKEFSDVADHHDACTELYGWYARRYGEELKLPKGSKGQKRGDGKDEQSYTFDRRYCDDRQFRNYLETSLPQHGSQDLLAFVMHMAVAFLVPLQELDEVLQKLGFHPLHVKNIHHLAIAYVLLMADAGTVDPDFNPFAQVKTLYFKALQILEDPDAPAGNAYSYADLETRMIRNMLLLRKGLATQNFEALVARNRTELNMRHSMILSDFHRLSAVFIHIFDSEAAPESFEMPEEAYSFYRFVIRFCHEETKKKTEEPPKPLTRKKFREQLTSMIDLQQKHPTRNVLILLWLYTYCFAFLPGIYIDKTAFNRITRQLKRFDPAWADQAKACYMDDLFDVYGFITGEPERDVPRLFRGYDFFVFINGKLQLRYGWGPLNDNLPFDHYICQLKDLNIRLDPVGCCSGAVYGESTLTDLAEDVDNVPFPLVAVTQILEHLKQLHTQKADQYKYGKLSPRPLKCSLYEQL